MSAQGSATPPPADARGRAARALLSLFVLVAGLVLLAATVAAVFDAVGGPRHLAQRLLKRAEPALGRPLDLADARLRLLPPGIELRGLSVGPAPGARGPAAEPLLRIARVRMSLSLLPTILALGRRVAIGAVEIEGLELQLVRLPDGRLSSDDVLRRLAGKLPPPPLPERQQKLLRRLRIGHLALRGIKLRFVDLPAARSFAVEQLDLRVEGLRAGAPFDLFADGAVLAAERNLHLEARLGPVPADLDVRDPLALLHRLSLRLQPLLLTRAQGVPLPVRLQVDASADLDAGDLLLRSFDLRAAEMEIYARADVRGLRRRFEVRALEIGSRQGTLEKLTALLPRGLLPPGLVLRGPLRLYASAGGPPGQARVAAGLDLSAATLRHPLFDKPAGMACGIGLRGRLGGAGLDIERLGAELGPVALWLSGQIRSPSDFDLVLGQGRVRLAQALRLLPRARRTAERRDARVAGTVELDGAVHRRAERLEAELRLLLVGTRVTLPGLALWGSGQLAVAAQDDRRAGSYRADADLAGMRLLARGVIDKPAGLPLGLHLRAERRERRVLVHPSSARFPGGALELSGSGDLDREEIDLDVPRLVVDLPSLSRMLPGVRDARLPEVRLRLALHIAGRPRHPETLRLRLASLELFGAGGSLQGRAEVQGLGPPRRVRFDLRGGGFDFGPFGHLRRPALRHPLLPVLRRLDLAGQVALRDTRIGDAAIRDLRARLRLTDGRLEVQELRADAWGGSLYLDGTHADVAADPPRFAAHLRIDRLDLRQFLSMVGPEVAWKLEGRLSADAQAEGAGSSWPAIAPSLRGHVNVTFTDGILRGVTAHMQVVNAGLKGLLGDNGVNTVKIERFPLGALTARLLLRDRRLTLAGPLRFANRDQVAQVSGSIGLDGTLALYGDLEALPTAVSAATRGRLASAAAIPLKFRVGGTGKLPAVALDRLDRTMAAAVGGILGVERAPELQPPRPVHAQPGRDAGGRVAQPLLSAGERQAQRLNRAGLFLFNLKLGPAVGLLDLPAQLAIQFELGMALTPDRRGYLLLPLQLQVAALPKAVLVPLGFQYDIPLPIQSLYLYPRVSLGYAALLPDPGEVRHLGVAVPEMGLKYVPIKRLNFGLEPLSFPIFFDGSQVLLSYRVLTYAGVNF